MSTDPDTSASWQPELTDVTTEGPLSPTTGPRHRVTSDLEHGAGPDSGTAGVTDTASAAVVLSAEQVHVSTVRRPTHRVRVRREILTEEVTVTVTVRREVLHVEQTPIDTASASDADFAPDLPRSFAPDEPYDQTSDDVLPSPGLLPTGSPSLEVVLSQEVPVVSVRTVPYERVRLTVRPVVTTTTLDVDVRREVADVVTTVPDPQTAGRDVQATT